MRSIVGSCAARIEVREMLDMLISIFLTPFWISKQMSRQISKRNKQKAREALENQQNISSDEEYAVPNVQSNPFDFLNTNLGDTCSEEEQDPESIEIDVIQPIQQKAKKKKKKKMVGQETTTVDDQDIDQITKELKEKYGEEFFAPVAPSSSSDSSAKNLLAVNPSLFDKNAELRRLFGSKVVNAQLASPSRSRAKYAPKSAFATPTDQWPRFKNPGLDMSLLETRSDSTLFSFTHSKAYQGKYSINKRNTMQIL